MTRLKIATRNSPLALWQAHFVKDKLEELHKDLSVEIVGMTTKGDQLLDRSLAKVGGKGLFLKELEVSLLNAETDIAVHSMKDVPVDLPNGLEIAVVCERHDPRDAFVSNNFSSLDELSNGAMVGTSSLRRVAQLKRLYPNLEFIELRGNINTRLKKLDDGQYDAIILASAGLLRLGMDHRIQQYISPEVCLPAVGQGIVGIECRSDDENVKRLLQPMNDRLSELCLSAERAMNAELDGGCQVPVAGYAEFENGQLFMRGLVARADGSEHLVAQVTSDIESVESVESEGKFETSTSIAKSSGQQVAKSLLEQGAKPILDEVYEHNEPHSNKPHRNKEVAMLPTVLLTRKKEFIGNMTSIFKTLDINVVHIPTIEITPYFNKESEGPLLEDIESINDFVFVSRNAVEYGMTLINDYGGLHENARVLAVGKETARELSKYGVDALYPEFGNGAEALMGVEQLENMDGQNVLIFRGLNGLSWIGKEMTSRGAQINYLNCYEQSIPENGAADFKALIEANVILDAVFLHSVQSAANLLEMAENHEDRDILLQSKVVVGSERIARFVRRKNWKGEIVLAKSPSNQDMMLANSGVEKFN